MKILSILRHAKSSWEFPELSDFDRPLLNKGVKRTLLICVALSQNASKPDLIISSPAMRAMETAQIIIDKLSIDNKKLIENEHFYPGHVKTLAKQIAKLNNKTEHAMVIGHNPGLTELANFYLENENIEWIPTSGLLQIKFNCKNWGDIDPSNAQLLQYIKPKELRTL